MLGGKKAAGLLTELSAELDRINYIILGVGMDVNLEASDFPTELRGTATSLRLATGRTWRRADLAAAILRELDRAYELIGRRQFASLADEWERHCSTLGRRVTIRVGDRRLTGQAESLDEDGALLLRTEHGRLERIIGGDVTLEQ